MNVFPSRRRLQILLAAACLAAPFSINQAMQSNLARPYGLKPSPPHDSQLVFYSPQSEDLLFTNEKEILIYCRVGVRSVQLDWSVARNMFKEGFLAGQAEALPDNRYLIRIPTDALKPGLFDVRVTLHPGDGTTIPGISTIGFQVDKMPITSDTPSDFKEFWEKGKKEIASIPLDPKVGEVKTYTKEEINAYNVASASLPEDYDPKGHRYEEVEAFKVDFASVDGLRVHGWVAKPKGDGPFPAMLVLPGAGFNARPIPLEHARHGFLAIDVQVHGQEVDLEEYPKLPGYYDNFTFEPPQDYYYRKTYLNALQGLNYLFSRPDVDKSKVVVVGGSQGGRLTTVVAGLDDRIAAAIPAIAHFANIPYLTWYKTSNEAKPPVNGMNLDAPPALPDTPEGRCMGYYDAMNFAPSIKCPVLMNAGLIDPVSNATGVFSIYNRLGTSDKTMIALPGMGHDWSAEFDRRAWRWLDQKLNLPSATGLKKN